MMLFLAHMHSEFRSVCLSKWFIVHCAVGIDLVAMGARCYNMYI